MVIYGYEKSQSDGDFLWEYTAQHQQHAATLYGADGPQSVFVGGEQRRDGLGIIRIARYVLLACGKPGVEAYAKLYAEMVQLAKESQGCLAEGRPAAVF